jgi:hypothetical protein
MARRSLTTNLYRAARLSNNLRAARGGPIRYAKRSVRRKVYAKQMHVTRTLLRAIGLSR